MTGVVSPCTDAPAPKIEPESCPINAPLPVSKISERSKMSKSIKLFERVSWWALNSDLGKSPVSQQDKVAA